MPTGKVLEGLSIPWALFRDQQDQIKPLPVENSPLRRAASLHRVPRGLAPQSLECQAAEIL